MGHLQLELKLPLYSYLTLRYYTLLQLAEEYYRPFFKTLCACCNISTQEEGLRK